ncbi:hypothetical protein [Sphingomonas endolithica]|uniref:hypothetical protein n=1 Tax=Sphingomonas endolithica TaxID=2972485 RepID=UPI0021AF81B4|nr:hypothetical protein [Sphingomonas sp. ZFBP2030]
MGDPDGLDGRVFATLNRVREHGGEQWWLYASTCSACGQNWMIAQDERIHDNFVLKRVEPADMERIVQTSEWPGDFLHYGEVLRIEREFGKVAHFADPRSPALVDTIHDLRRERPDISIEDIAFALAISAESTERLLRM